MLLTRLGVPCLVSIINNLTYIGGNEITKSALAMHLIQPCLIVIFANLQFPYFQSDLVNVFEVFLPQLLIYPNASDPLNDEAASLMMRDSTAYEQKVKGSNPC